MSWAASFMRCTSPLGIFKSAEQVGRECRRRAGEAGGFQVMEGCLLQTDSELSKVSAEVISRWGWSDEPLL